MMPTPLHYYFFFSFSDLTSAHINVTPRDKDVGFLLLYIPTLFCYIFYVNFEMRNGAGRWLIRAI